METRIGASPLCEALEYFHLLTGILSALVSVAPEVARESTWAADGEEPSRNTKQCNGVVFLS